MIYLNWITWTVLQLKRIVIVLDNWKGTVFSLNINHNNCELKAIPNCRMAFISYANWNMESSISEKQWILI